MVAVIDLTTHLAWSAASVRDMHMLRSAEMNDLLPGVQRLATGRIERGRLISS